MIEKKSENSDINTLFFEYKRTNDKKIRDELIEKHLYIARILSKRFINRGIDYDDIYQVAVMGIIYAVERFDPQRGVCFATFATPTVLGEIRKYFRDKGNFIRVPRSLCTIFYRAERIRYSTSTEHIDDEELSRRLNITVEDLKQAYKAGDASFIRSLEYEANTDGRLSLSNVLGTDNSDFLMIEDKDFVKYALSQLDERERRIIKARFYEGLSQQLTAKREGVSQVHISRIEKSALKKLRDLYFHE